MALKPLSVSQLNAYIKRVLQSEPLLKSIRVKGEVSNLKYHGSGHVYFSLKDETSRINCFIHERVSSELPFRLSEGMELCLNGYIYLFERGGTYSVNVNSIDELGEGALNAEFERLKAKLSEEGLFDKEHKKKIPAFAKRIAVVTSDTGAALQDILKIIKNKNDFTSVLIYPCLVQGPDAPLSIAHAIDELNKNFSDIDCMIVGRGGGASEELWAFNSEEVVRSIYASEIPVISAVGHEIDYTLSDLAADLRAETPTAAAEAAVFDSHECRDVIRELAASLGENFEDLLLEREDEISALRQGLADAVRLKTENCELLLRSRLEALNSLNPAAILLRGYSMVTAEDGSVISGVSELEVGESVNIRMSDGSLGCLVEDIRREENGKNS